MIIVAYANQKGGVGKTAVSTHFAWHIAGQGYNTLYIELDAQGNASYSLQASKVALTASRLFEPKTIPDVRPDQHHMAVIGGDPELNNLDRAPLDVIETFLANVDALGEHFDVCVIDTNPSLGLRTLAALFAADFVVSPVEVETYSIQGTTQLLQNIRGVEERKKAAGMSLTFVGMLPNKVNNTSPVHLENLRDLISAYPKLVIPHKISQRTSIGEALGEQKPVWSLEKSAAREAAREMRKALNAIQERIGLKKKESKK